MQDLILKPIATIRSGFKEKFGIPRQSGLVKSMHSSIEFAPEFSSPAALSGLETCSHLWLIFIFSESVGKGWSPSVRPPRLGGNEKMGVFATRSPFRPNPIGLSCVKLEKIETEPNTRLIVSGADLMDGTPILDIKPYLPYADALEDAQFEFASEFKPPLDEICFSEQSEKVCQAVAEQGQDLKTQIQEVISCDPRPAYQRQSDREYGIRLYDYNIRWRVTGEKSVEILSIQALKD